MTTQDLPNCMSLAEVSTGMNIEGIKAKGFRVACFPSSIENGQVCKNLY